MCLVTVLRSKTTPLLLFEFFVVLCILIAGLACPGFLYILLPLVVPFVLVLIALVLIKSLVVAPVVVLIKISVLLFEEFAASAAHTVWSVVIIIYILLVLALYVATSLVATTISVSTIPFKTIALIASIITVALGTLLLV